MMQVVRLVLYQEVSTHSNSCPARMFPHSCCLMCTWMAFVLAVCIMLVEVAQAVMLLRHSMDLEACS